MSQFRQPVQFKWRGTGRYEYGRWVPGAEVERDIEASVQPMSMQDVADMPEGERFGQMVKVYTDDDSIPVHQFSQDRVTFTWRGFEWVVISDESHFSGVIDHRKLIARRVVTEDTP
jgi:hypothetical protein|nr:MAG TPA: Minor capsid protein [Caudoviricetes sp.]